MKECGWLTVKQLLVYHSLIQLHKTILQQAPTYLYKRITDQLSILETILETSSHYNYKTRQEASGVLRQVPGAEARLDLAERSWCWIKNLVKQAKFKVELKAWVMKNVEP